MDAEQGEVSLEVELEVGKEACEKWVDTSGELDTSEVVSRLWDMLSALLPMEQFSMKEDLERELGVDASITNALSQVSTTKTSPRLT